jgi:hypothetical protein
LSFQLESAPVLALPAQPGSDPTVPVEQSLGLPEPPLLPHAVALRSYTSQLSNSGGYLNSGSFRQSAPYVKYRSFS